MIEAADLLRVPIETRVVIDELLERGVPVVEVSQNEIHESIALAASHVRPFWRFRDGDLGALDGLPEASQQSAEDRQTMLLGDLVLGFYRVATIDRTIEVLFVSPRTAFYLAAHAIMGYLSGTLRYETDRLIHFMGVPVRVGVDEQPF